MRIRALVTGRHDAGVLWSLRRSMPFVDVGEEALLLVGDRYETALAAIEVTRKRTPIIHLHGGEVTEGAFDDAYRNAITKLAHLHLVSTVAHGSRVVNMGEDPDTVHVVGAPGIDNLYRDDLPSRRLLEIRLGIPLSPPVVIVTLHPATLGADPREEHAAVQAAMNAIPATYVVTLPNTDPGHEHLRRWDITQPHVIVDALGERDYWGLMRIADAMLGNSSSGLIEAPAVQLPVVNIGDRQKGRLRGCNVVDVGPQADAVAMTLDYVLSREFRDGLSGTYSLYGDGHSGERIAALLKTWQPPVPLRKRVTC